MINTLAIQLNILESEGEKEGLKFKDAYLH